MIWGRSGATLGLYSKSGDVPWSVCFGRGLGVV